jgi:hypothetical protein
MRTKMNLLTQSLGWFLFISILIVMSGCGGGATSTHPQPASPEAIPAELLRVDLANSTNSCGADDPGLFSTIMNTGVNGASIGGLGVKSVPATVSGDRITFTLPVTNMDGTTAFTGDWTFQPGRHTFTGSMTAE